MHFGQLAAFTLVFARLPLASLICVLPFLQLDSIQKLHKKGYIHRDIKPDNFLMGREENPKTVYMIDLGLSKKFKNSRNVHVPYATGKR